MSNGFCDTSSGGSPVALSKEISISPLLVLPQADTQSFDKLLLPSVTQVATQSSLVISSGDAHLAFIRVKTSCGVVDVSRSCSALVKNASLAASNLVVASS